VKHHCISASFLPNVLAALEMGMTKSRRSYERTIKTFICPSQFMADKMIEWGEPASQFVVARMPMMTPSERAMRDGGYVLAVGRLSPEKGYEELIRAIAHVPTLQLKIAGTGPEHDRLQALIRSLGVANVELVGFKRGEELWELYRHAEAFIASPIGYENSPLTVLDALAYGLPILATRIGGLPEMVHDGVNGYLVERASVDGWISTLKRFAGLSVVERATMANASFDHGQKTYPDWEGHLEELEKIYVVEMK
jgi:glycosyltransferase involved in cell wall biosynthesis